MRCGKGSKSLAAPKYSQTPRSCQPVFRIPATVSGAARHPAGPVAGP
ncbi:hypothetical protein XA26_51530 [Mycolicibacterium fortuitum]|uniref:Uncharacterized protein n=1 Tax=Mycolicibacterium fortuitum TaxID=1766 RepID=A0A0N9YH34_MYCFO|nr:hypothetical protein XA26_51530 [Mycolicibacterium fortuitum]